MSGGLLFHRVDFTCIVTSCPGDGGNAAIRICSRCSEAQLSAYLGPEGSKSASVHIAPPASADILEFGYSDAAIIIHQPCRRLLLMGFMGVMSWAPHHGRRPFLFRFEILLNDMRHIDAPVLIHRPSHLRDGVSFHTLHLMCGISLPRFSIRGSLLRRRQTDDDQQPIFRVRGEEGQQQDRRSDPEQQSSYCNCTAWNVAANQHLLILGALLCCKHGEGQNLPQARRGEAAAIDPPCDRNPAPSSGERHRPYGGPEFNLSEHSGHCPEVLHGMGGRVHKVDVIPAVSDALTVANVKVEDTSV